MREAIWSEMWAFCCGRGCACGVCTLLRETSYTPSLCLLSPSLSALPGAPREAVLVR